MAIIRKQLNDLSSLLSFLSKCEEEQRVKFVHLRSFTKFRKTLQELNFDPLGFLTEKDPKKRPCITFINDIPSRAVLTVATLDCQHGKDYHGRSKKKYEEKMQEMLDKDHSHAIKRRLLVQDSEKLGCPAKVKISRHIQYISHVLKDPTRHRQGEMRKKLLKSSRDDITWREIFTIEIPPAELHEKHPVGKDSHSRQPIDPRVLNKLKDLVQQTGIRNAETISNHLNDFVKTVLYTRNTAPPENNKRFYPEHKTVYNYIYSTIAEQLYSSDDQENLNHLLENLPKIEHKYFYRPLTQTDSEDFLFVYQSTSQQRLMQKYGNEICLLDATYKTTKYALPLFFVVVPTNTRYQVVATFMVSKESSAAISEALAMIKQWNSTWTPAYWMSDFCAAEMNALKTVFAESIALLCDFHRLQAWNRFLVKLDNGISKQIALKLKKEYLNPLANSATEEEYLQRRQLLLQSKEWKDHPKLQAYMLKTWLDEETCKRWVHCFKRDRLMRSVRTNNGIESINNSVKKFTKGPRSLSLVQLFNSLLRWYSKLYNKYCMLNFQLSTSVRKYNKIVPSCLHERPHQFTTHVMKRLPAAQSLDKHDYVVTSGDRHTCTCLDFQRHSYPCKHILKNWLSDNNELLVIPSSSSDPWWTMDRSVAQLANASHPQQCISPNTPSPELEPPAIQHTISISQESDTDQCSNVNKKKDSELKHIKSLSYQTNFTNATVDMVKSKLQEIEKLILPELSTKHLIPILSKTTNSATTSHKRRITTTLLKRRKYTPIKYRSRTVSYVKDYTVGSLEECNTSGNSQVVKATQPVPKSAINEDKIEKKVKDIPINIDILSPSYQLDDNDINMALKLIRKHWCDVTAQDCLYIQRQKCFAPAQKYVQVLHMKDYQHWVAVTNVSARHNEVRYFDSLDLTPNNIRIMKAIASLEKTPCRKVNIRLENVQRQQGTTDCGVFAIANLVEVLCGLDPRKARFDQQKMREHLFKCLSKQEFQSFPKQSQPVIRLHVRDRLKSFSVYCICRLIWNPDSNSIHDDMVECPSCKEWYHLGCIRIPPTARCPLTGDLDNFTCQPCIDRGRAVI